jgi:hypothetical protein
MIKFFHKENHFFVKNERGKEVYGIRHKVSQHVLNGKWLYRNRLKG